MKRLLVPFLFVFVTFLLVGCGPQATDPVSVSRAFCSALNDRNVDRATNHFAENAEFITAMGQPVGKAKIHDLIKNLVAIKSHLSIKELQAEGESMTGTADYTSTHVNFALKMKAVIRDGKIISMTWGN